MKRCLLTFVAVLASVLCSAAWQADNWGEPAHHDSPPPAGEKLPPILTPSQLKAQGVKLPYQWKVYQLAAKADGTLYQMPCYCRCDRSAGHQSLRSCFESTHGAHCSTCMQEAVFTYQQQKAGKSAEEIRDAINRGDYQKVDLTKIAGLR